MSECPHHFFIRWWGEIFARCIWFRYAYMRKVYVSTIASIHYGFCLCHFTVVHTNKYVCVYIIFFLDLTVCARRKFNLHCYLLFSMWWRTTYCIYVCIYAPSCCCGIYSLERIERQKKNKNIFYIYSLGCKFCCHVLFSDLF